MVSIGHSYKRLPVEALTGWQWTWFTAGFFRSVNKPKQGQVSTFLTKKYNPAYNLQSMILDREVDNVNVE